MPFNSIDHSAYLIYQLLFAIVMQYKLIFHKHFLFGYTAEITIN